jgi:hypothetical protein
VKHPDLPQGATVEITKQSIRFERVQSCIFRITLAVTMVDPRITAARVELSLRLLLPGR